MHTFHPNTSRTRNKMSSFSIRFTFSIGPFLTRSVIGRGLSYARLSPLYLSPVPHTLLTRALPYWLVTVLYDDTSIHTHSVSTCSKRRDTAHESCIVHTADESCHVHVRLSADAASGVYAIDRRVSQDGRTARTFRIAARNPYLSARRQYMYSERRPRVTSAPLNDTLTVHDTSRNPEGFTD